MKLILKIFQLPSNLSETLKNLLYITSGKYTNNVQHIFVLFTRWRVNLVMYILLNIFQYMIYWVSLTRHHFRRLSCFICIKLVIYNIYISMKVLVNMVLMVFLFIVKCWCRCYNKGTFSFKLLLNFFVKGSTCSCSWK